MHRRALQAVTTKQSSSVRILGRSLDLMLERATRQANKDLREICGLLVDTGRGIDLVQTRNLCRRAMGFRLSPSDARAIERQAKQRGHSVVGTFHSHILARPIPSAGDIDGAFDGDLMLILDTIADRQVRAAMWWIREGATSRVRIRRISRGA